MRAAQDLVAWEKSDGTPLSLPITIDTGDVVDPVPPKGGIINGNVRIGFDHEKRTVITYHKYDDTGKNPSLQRASRGRRLEDPSSHRLGLPVGIQRGRHHPLRRQRLPRKASETDGRLTQQWRNDELGRQLWRLDPESLRGVEQLPLPPSILPAGFGTVQSDFPGMAVKSAGDNGTSGDPNVRYMLRWETLGKTPRPPTRETLARPGGAPALYELKPTDTN